ncbi:MAG: BlaI/MecI/CopY family transcriptional regulator [Candidatus Pacebacteria bacterium]|nr:BlaI/MecI/CopY family transcriptional regulator [Candidatus Paceibacterota bacterium]
MDNIDIERVLKNFGFTDKEMPVYLSLLELETATASQIADDADINRSTVYVVIESLQKKGLISTQKEEGNVTKYTAAPPERLLQLAEEETKKYKTLVGEIHNILPELKSKYPGNKQRPRVRLYEGKEGLISAYEDTLTSSEEILAYASIENMHKAIPGYFPDYYSRRANKGISIKSIHPDTEEARERAKSNKKESRNSALVPASKYNFSPEINIYDNKIVFMSLVEKFSLIIESAELAEAFKKIFDLSWGEARRLNKK